MDDYNTMVYNWSVIFAGVTGGVAPTRPTSPEQMRTSGGGN